MRRMRPNPVQLVWRLTKMTTCWRRCSTSMFVREASGVQTVHVAAHGGRRLVARQAETMLSEGTVEEVPDSDGVTFVQKPILQALGAVASKEREAVGL